jgi:hypothetical protein
MIKLIPASSKRLIFNSVAIVCALTACTPGLQKKPVPFDTSSVTQIEFKLGTIKQASLKTNLYQQDGISRISKNLADWGYPLGDKNTPIFSHSLTAEIGLPEHSNTPTGLSFFAGNSDPRAIDFQKADVIPIGCELRSIAQPEQTTFLTMDFAAGSSINEAKLIDHISTVCFNLLSELNWPDKAKNQLSSSIKPNWIPEVRIETITNPIAVEKTDKSDKASEEHKQIIIHNQGSPVIFSFGHERR